MNSRRTSGSNCAETVPTAYELVDKRGRIRGRFPSAQSAGIAARERWPDQEQDEDRTGKGWDVQVAGCGE